MVPLPNTSSRFADAIGSILQPWISYLQQFTQVPPNIKSLTVTASPFSYIVKEPGTIAITGGTVSAVSLTRGAITIVLGATVKLVPVAIKDVVKVTYSVLPTIQFIPSYGQNTTT